MTIQGSSRDGWCKHRTAYTKDFKTCKVGVDFHQFQQRKPLPVLGPNELFRRGSPLGCMPCSGEPNHEEAAKVCPQFTAWTPEECAERKRDTEERFGRIGTIRGAILENINATGIFSGDIPCPSCKSGTVSYSQASNGHVHARCSTANCASWME